MTMQELIEKLKARPQAGEEHRREQRRAWQRALADLFAQLEGWLAPAVTAGVLTTTQTTTTLSEQDLGEYQAPALQIDDGNLTVRIEPVGGRVANVVSSAGRRPVGLRGRVDLVCGPIRIPLVREATGAWRALPFRGEPRELTEESFAEILREVLLDE
jgi:hypothetical protein